MFLLLLYIVQALNYASMLDVDRPWSDQFNVNATAYDSGKEAPKKAEMDILRDILKDPDNVISNTFKIPNGLKDRVVFWAQIYAIYPSTAVLIHDRDDLTVVYKAIDIDSVVPGKNDRGLTKEAVFRKRVTEERDSIKKILRKISSVGGVKYFSSRIPEEKRIAKLVRSKMSNEESKNAYENIRTQDGQKDNLIKGIKASSKYLPIIEDIFKENNLPWELTRLPFVESSFEIRAGSKVGAKGIWQIINKTGEKYLGTDPSYDERYSPFKASAVAAEILKADYKLLGTWPLAITAYNHGPGGLKKAIKKLKTKDISKIVAEYESDRFGFASQNFYSEFLAALYVTVYSEKLFGNIEKEHPMNFSYVTVEKDIDVNALSKISGLNVSEIQNYNPEFSKKMLEGQIKIKAGSKIKLPPRASYKVEDYFIRSKDSNGGASINVSINN